MSALYYKQRANVLPLRFGDRTYEIIRTYGHQIVKAVRSLFVYNITLTYSFYADKE